MLTRLPATRSGLVFLAFVVVAVTTPLIASNMGFKLAISLADGPSGNQVSLPYIPKDGIETAEDLINEINLQAGADVAPSISRIVRSTDAHETYNLTTGGTNFSLTPDDGYVIFVSEPVPNFVLAGTHDPSRAISLLDESNPGSNSGAQLISLPFHITAFDAEDLINDIESQGGVVSSVGHYVRSTGLLETYSLVSGGTNFSLSPGEAYSVIMDTAVDYIPSHF